ncbi:hypothetical protein Y695_02952 [Hydrogenophaga sp. T4]|nr:hypothetical protein Y695_02952 [Hydrogenophaga sp. T4]
MGGELLHFFAAATEDERVAPLEADHLLAFARQLHQQPVDLLLAHGVFVAPLAGKDALRTGRSEVEHARRHQVVVDDDVGLLQQAHRFERQQFRVARPAPTR